MQVLTCFRNAGFYLFQPHGFGEHDSSILRIVREILPDDKTPPGVPRTGESKQGGVSMYAIVETGGKQYKVAPGDVIKVEKLQQEVGQEITLDQVLLVAGEEGVRIGSPVVDGAVVKAKVLRQDKDRKVLVFRYKAKKNIRKRYGHRQPFTMLRILAIEA